MRNEHDGDRETVVCPVCRHTLEAEQCGWRRRLPAHDRDTGAVAELLSTARCPGSYGRPAPTAQETLHQVGRGLARAACSLDDAAELYPEDRDELAHVTEAVREAWVRGVAAEEGCPRPRQHGERPDDDATVWLGSDPEPHVMVTAPPAYGKAGRVRRVLKPDAVVEIADGKSAWDALAFPDVGAAQRAVAEVHDAMERRYAQLHNDATAHNTREDDKGRPGDVPAVRRWLGLSADAWHGVGLLALVLTAGGALAYLLSWVLGWGPSVSSMGAVVVALFLAGLSVVWLMRDDLAASEQLRKNAIAQMRAERESHR